jgi:uncharacterized lipoprotein YmbA
MKLKRFSALLLLVGALGVGGCITKLPTALYQLDSGSPTVSEKSSGLAVLLQRIDIADYLGDATLLQRQPDGSLVADQDARWAGNLAENINNVMLRRLSWRLDDQRLALAPAPGFNPDIQVHVSIDRLDSGPLKPAVLEAQWRLLDRKGQLLSSRLIRLEESHLGNVADQVRAQSEVLQQLAEQLAGDIQPLARQITAARKSEAAKAARAAQSTAEPAPKIPVAEPVRADVEVYRF